MWCPECADTETDDSVTLADMHSGLVEESVIEKWVSFETVAVAVMTAIVTATMFSVMAF